MILELKISTVEAELLAEAIDTVLNNCDVHVEEGVPLEQFQERLEMALEKARDYASDVEPLY